MIEPGFEPGQSGPKDCELLIVAVDRLQQKPSETLGHVPPDRDLPRQHALTTWIQERKTAL